MSFRITMEVLVDHDDQSSELVDFCVLSDKLFSRVWRFWRAFAVSPLPHGTRLSLCNGAEILETVRLPVVDNPYNRD